MQIQSNHLSDLVIDSTLWNRVMKRDEIANPMCNLTLSKLRDNVFSTFVIDIIESHSERIMCILYS